LVVRCREERKKVTGKKEQDRKGTPSGVIVDVYEGRGGRRRRHL